jgi:hypothetical protein
MSTLEDKIASLQGKYDAIADDPEVNAICNWVQPNTSEQFDEVKFDKSFENSLSAFFALDNTAAELIKARHA